MEWLVSPHPLLQCLGLSKERHKCPPQAGHRRRLQSGKLKRHASSKVQPLQAMVPHHQEQECMLVQITSSLHMRTTGPLVQRLSRR